MYHGSWLCNGYCQGLSLMQWRRPGGAVVQVYWTEHPQDGALEWSSTGPPSSAAATTLRVSSSELSHCVYVLYFGQLLCCAVLLSTDIHFVRCLASETVMVGFDLFSTVGEVLTCRHLWRPVVFLMVQGANRFRPRISCAGMLIINYRMSRLELPYDSANSVHPGSTSDKMRRCCQRPWRARVEMTRVGLLGQVSRPNLP